MRPLILCTTDALQPFSEEIGEKTRQPVAVRRIERLPEERRDQVRIVITFGNYDDSVSSEELRSLPRLEWIQVISSGIEQLPLEYLSERGILVTTARGIHRIPMSEYVFSALLYFAKKIPAYARLKRDKTWGRFETMEELYGKTIGILGTGQIGGEIAYKAKAFGMTTLGVNRSGRLVQHFDRIYPLSEWEHILPLCDYVCGILPSAPETKQLINRRTIEQMKDGVIFINVGRGDLVVEQDLVEALERGKIAGAALDVFAQEPLDRRHPLWELDNVIITPHASAKTPMYVPRSLDIFYRNYALFRQGRTHDMINLVKHPQ